MDETLFKKIAQAHLPWIIHFAPIGVLMIVITLFPGVTYRWKMMGVLITMLYAYIFCFVELTNSPRRPSNSGMRFKRIKLDLALLTQIIVTIGIWNFGPTNQYLFWGCVTMSLFSGAVICLEWIFHWP